MSTIDLTPIVVALPTLATGLYLTHRLRKRQKDAKAQTAPATKPKAATKK
ncbi:MAG: hypothetical protein H6666_01800 [Ardenticatenaceae bacterium]|nr:hypothetical protein [Anaerolineales bacterium]MCB8916631.1 hypothetical protein [Ardenticatenaceae bacterium]